MYIYIYAHIRVLTYVYTHIETTVNIISNHKCLILGRHMKGFV